MKKEKSADLQPVKLADIDLKRYKRKLVSKAVYAEETTDLFELLSRQGLPPQDFVSRVSEALDADLKKIESLKDLQEIRLREVVVEDSIYEDSHYEFQFEREETDQEMRHRLKKEINARRRKAREKSKQDSKSVLKEKAELKRLRRKYPNV